MIGERALVGHGIVKHVALAVAERTRIGVAVPAVVVGNDDEAVFV